MSYSVVTDVLSPAASYALTDLASAKIELSISDTSNDAWLSTNAIPQVSGSIQRHIKRPVAPEYLRDSFDIEQDPYPYQTPGGFAQLQLSRWPVLGVTSVVQTLAPGPQPRLHWLHEGRDYRVNRQTGQLLRLNRFTGVGTLWEALPVTVTYSAGFGALVRETNTVPSAAPWQVTVQQAAIFSCPQSVQYSGGQWLELVAANPAQGQYAVSAATLGQYSFNAADADQDLAFAYATANVPPDLVEIALKLITARFRVKGRDPLLVQEDLGGAIGTRRYWFDNTQTSSFPPDIEDALDYYRVPTVA